MLKLIFVLVILFLTKIESLKIGIFVPDIAGSQILFNQRVAEALSDGGHDVTLFRLRYMEYFDVKARTREGIHEWIIDSHVPGMDLGKLLQLQVQLDLNDDSSFGDFTQEKREIFSNASTFFAKGCEKIINNKDFLDKLKNAEFDVIFAHIADFCPIGLIHIVKPKSWAWLNGGPLLDHMATFMGLSLPASYAPPVMMDTGEHMTLFERVKSVIGHTMTPIVLNSLFISPANEVFRKTFGPDFPDLGDLAKSAPLVFTGSSEFYDFPRPTLSKILYIGGIGMRSHKAKSLPQDVQEKIDKTNNTIVFSFGSFTNASLMSMKWKKAFMEAFAEFPKTQFFMRYPINDMNDFKPSNVELMKWLPQMDLLNHPKTKALITHAGFNSLQEAINSAIPLIAIPLFGDQFKTGQIMKKHKLGITLSKSSINKDSVVKAIREILQDEAYSQAVLKMKKMIEMDPFPAEKKLVKWTEFLAEFRTLDNLRPVGAELDFITFYNVDVYFLFGIIVISVLALVYLGIKLTIRKVSDLCHSKTKKE